MTAAPQTTHRSITKSVSIQRDAPSVFAYLADLAHWPDWAIVNVKATSPIAGSEWWNMETTHGAAKLRLHADRVRGVLDHDFVDAQASWTVPARVVANGAGAEFMMTFFQPPGFTDDFFDQQIKLVDIELAKLKAVLEAA
jgi:hypothetical protein